MKKGINIWSFPKDWSLQQCMHCAKASGFEGIELSFSPDGCISPESTDQQILSCAQLAADEGITIGGLAGSAYNTYSLSASSRHVRQEAKQMIRRHLEAARLLNVDTILTVPMNAGHNIGDDPRNPVRGELQNYEEAFDLAVEGLRELAPFAEELRVNIGIENVWNGALLSPRDAKQMIDAVASPFVGMYLDVGNMRKWSRPEQWIDVLGNRIRCVHLKDYHISANIFVDLLEGDVDFPAVMQGLNRLRYDGWLFAEMDPPYRSHPELSVSAASRAMDIIMELEEGSEL